ncbi:MAG: efflux pump, RND family, membrane fusion protein [Actinobacteria bacterium]|nr:efflux pump, RND family, membrane fusion protein [Actinomycetota bacterium]
MRWCNQQAVLFPLLLALGCGAGPAKTAEAPRQAPAGQQETVQAEGICKEHGVLEALCTQCNPKLAAVFKAKGDWCEEHGFPESVCPKCHPERGGRPAVDVASDEAPADGTKVRLKTGDTARLAGIETVRAVPGRGVSEIVAPAVIAYDSSRVAQVNARSPGVVKSLQAEVGAWVREGESLAVIESASLSADQSRLDAVLSRMRMAEVNYRREEELERKGISSRKEVSAAEQELKEAKAGSEALAASLGVVRADPGSRGRYVVTAPISGIVTQRNVSPGRFVDSHETLFEIIDTSSMWAEVAVPEEALGSVRIGGAVVLTVSGIEGREFRGTIAQLASFVDPQTRTAKARVRLSNPNGLLRANMYGQARIAAGGSRSSAAVPRGAIQRAKTAQVAFVRMSPNEYETRRVQVAPSRGDDDLVEVASGILPGEEVVVAGSFFLKTETLKDSIGAGCCDVDARK